VLEVVGSGVVLEVVGSGVVLEVVGSGVLEVVGSGEEQIKVLISDGLPRVHEGPLVKMLERQRVQQAAADAAKKLVDAAVIAARKLADATKEAEETATAAAAAAALSAPEEAQVAWAARPHGGLLLCAHVSDRHGGLLLCAHVSACHRPSETSVS
jgi:hypothetical protein